MTPWIAAWFAEPSANPVELGRVAWRRGFEVAATEAREAGRPLLVLFDEVPG